MLQFYILNPFSFTQFSGNMDNNIDKDILKAFYLYIYVSYFNSLLSLKGKLFSPPDGELFIYDCIKLLEMKQLHLKTTNRFCIHEYYTYPPHTHTHTIRIQSWKMIQSSKIDSIDQNLYQFLIKKVLYLQTSYTFQIPLWKDKTKTLKFLIKDQNYSFQLQMNVITTERK